MKLAIVYWSGTGNTEAMANAIAEAAGKNGAETALFTPADVPSDLLSSYDCFAFGCPAVGDEGLEDTEFQPMFEELEPDLKGKKVALFGSYGWGDGEWMRQWEAQVKKDGANLVEESLIVNEMPDDEGMAACAEFGKKLASA